MVGQRGCRVVGAKDLSGCPLPAVGHSGIVVFGEALHSITVFREVTQRKCPVTSRAAVATLSS